MSNWNSPSCSERWRTRLKADLFRYVRSERSYNIWSGVLKGKDSKWDERWFLLGTGSTLLTNPTWRSLNVPKTTALSSAEEAEKLCFEDAAGTIPYKPVNAKKSVPCFERMAAWRGYTFQFFFTCTKMFSTSGNAFLRSLFSLDLFSFLFWTATW